MHKILVIGGGEKQRSLAAVLGKTYSVMHFEGIVPKEALTASDTVILPLPASADGIHVNFSQTKLSHIFDGNDRLYIGGRIGKEFAQYRKKHTIIDYTECEDFKIRNAVPSAEAAVMLAIENTSFTIFGSDCLVCGYGKIGAYLSKLLNSMGANVTVAARRSASRALAETEGSRAVGFDKISKLNPDIIFNTVPFPVITNSVLQKISPHIIIDLASANGGTDFDAAKKYGIKTLHALALPGKFSPESSAKITADTIISLGD